MVNARLPGILLLILFAVFLLNLIYRIVLTANVIGKGIFYRSFIYSERNFLVFNEIYNKQSNIYFKAYDLYRGGIVDAYT